MASVMDSVNQLTELVGQNRMELLLFRLSGRRQRYGINVFKVREVLPCPRLTVMPKLHKYVIGVAHSRGQTLSVIDLANAIGGRPTPSENYEKSYVIIAEYNRSTHAFLVSNVERIMNINWSKIMPPPKGAGHSNYMTAVTEIDNELVEILDVEKILVEISPHEVPISTDVIEKAQETSQKLGDHLKVLIADDSKVALGQVSKALTAIGVDILKANDGKEAYEILCELAEKGPIKDQIALVISDVEMPEMDGYTLCASIRQNPALKDLYIILHTSLSGVFNQSLVSKVGANAFIPKFNPDELANAVEKGIALVASGESAQNHLMS